MIGLLSLLLPIGVVIGLVAWVRADWRYQFRWEIRRKQLKREVRWAELRTYLDRNYNTRNTDEPSFDIHPLVVGE